MTAYYNEIDSSAATILRELIARNVIAPGVVDERSIVDVQPGDLAGFTQCHFFAGGGLWSVAARIAGWPDDRSLWTGSCPCQPFSQAGKRAGTDDPRHLWPHFYRLIRACRPPVVMGEQVAGAAGYGWFDGVRADLAGEDYPARAVDIPACAVDAPHQRNRLYWLAVDNRQRAGWQGQRGDVAGAAQGRQITDRFVTAGNDLVQLQPNADSGRRDGRPEASQREAQQRAAIERADGCILANADRQGQLQCEGIIANERRWPLHRHDATPNGSWWADAEWIVSPLDGKARRSFSRVSSLAYGLSARLVAVGNDSFIGVQAEMIAYADATQDRPSEILRALREGVFSACSAEAEGRTRRPCNGLGSAEGFPPSQVLLSVLCEYDRRTDGGRCLLTISKDARTSMRGVRRGSESPQPSCEREHLRQLSGQPANSLRELSHILARDAATIGQAAGATDAEGLGFLTPSFPGRVDLWRVGGNAISPILAAEVVAAAREALDQ